jgi:ligand-binding SRPBCC domain-containing protein
MTLYELHREQTVVQPLADVFDFFAQPENLARLTPEAMRFCILTPSPIAMSAGAVIDYTIHIFGRSLRWTTVITEFQPPYRFVDIQLRGPYSFWHHTHTFADTPHGTLIRDHVRYALPFGLVGRLAHTLAVRRQLEGVFDYRAGIITSMFDTRGTGFTQRTHKGSHE